MATKHKRRKKLIDKKFQIPIALTLAATGLVMLVFHFVIVDYLITASRHGAVLEPRPFLHIVPMMAVLVFAYYWLGIVVSHRIVGPAYRLIQTMKGLNSGDFSIRAHLRQGDGLKDVASELNELADSLEARKSGHLDALSQLRDAVRSGANEQELLEWVSEAESMWASADEIVAGAEHSLDPVIDRALDPADPADQADESE